MTKTRKLVDLHWENWHETLMAAWFSTGRWATVTSSPGRTVSCLQRSRHVDCDLMRGMIGSRLEQDDHDDQTNQEHSLVSNLSRGSTSRKHQKIESMEFSFLPFFMVFSNTLLRGYNAGDSPWRSGSIRSWCFSIAATYFPGQPKVADPTGWMGGFRIWKRKVSSAMKAVCLRICVKTRGIWTIW